MSRYYTARLCLNLGIIVTGISLTVTQCEDLEIGFLLAVLLLLATVMVRSYIVHIRGEFLAPLGIPGQMTDMVTDLLCGAGAFLATGEHKEALLFSSIAVLSIGVRNLLSYLFVLAGPKHRLRRIKRKGLRLPFGYFMALFVAFGQFFSGVAILLVYLTFPSILASLSVSALILLSPILILEIWACILRWSFGSSD